MVHKYKKSRLLFFLTLIALSAATFSSCGGTLATKTDKTPTSSVHTPRSGTPGTQLKVPVQQAATPTPTATTSPSTDNSGRFTTLPPGNVLPSDAECAARVRPSTEIHPDNTTANNTNFYLQGVRLTGSYLTPYGYQERVTGNFTGTTDEILQWGACKWGIDEDIVRSIAQGESTWHQPALGDCRGNTIPETHGCQSVGILQIKDANIPPTHPGTWPYAYQSTAFNVDYVLAILRTCFEGKETWLGNGYHAGDIWGCVGRWYSGDWYESSQDYITNIKANLANRDWLKPGF